MRAEEKICVRGDEVGDGREEEVLGARLPQDNNINAPIPIHSYVRALCAKGRVYDRTLP